MLKAKPFIVHILIDIPIIFSYTQIYKLLQKLAYNNYEQLADELIQSPSIVHFAYFRIIEFVKIRLLDNG